MLALSPSLSLPLIRFLQNMTTESWASRSAPVAIGDLSSVWREVTAAPPLSAAAIAEAKARPLHEVRLPTTQPTVGGFATPAAPGGFGGGFGSAAPAAPFALGASTTVGSSVPPFGSSPFGSSAAAPPSSLTTATPDGTRWCAFAPFVEHAMARDAALGRMVQLRNVYQSITVMPQYEKYTFEELRDQDERSGISHSDATGQQSFGGFFSPPPDLELGAVDSRAACIPWQKTGACKFGDRCRFGHGAP